MPSPSTQRKRPCSICRRWFRPSPRLKGRQTVCDAEPCQRARREANVRSWRARQPERLKRTCAEVLTERPGNSIRSQATASSPLTSQVLPEPSGNSIPAERAVVAGLVARLSQTDDGNSIRSQLLRLEALGRAVVGGAS